MVNVNSNYLSTRMEDICIACENALATVTPQCGHRQYCAACFQQTQNQNNGAQNCGLCRQSIVAVSDTTASQLQPLTLGDSLHTYYLLQQDYPFGCLLFGNEAITSTDEAYNIVKQAMEAVGASKLELSQLKKALRRRLTIEQYQLVFVELIKNEDLHSALKRLDKRKFETETTVKKVKQMVAQPFESIQAVVNRSLTISTTYYFVKNDLSELGESGFVVISSLTIFSIFTAQELYKWSKGHPGLEVVKNIGEHATGTVFGAAGMLLGFKVGTIVAPGLSTGGLIGSLIGGLCFDGASRLVYREIVPSTVEKYVKEERELTPPELAEKAALKFHIDINSFTFEEAQARYRRILVANHPDKHPGASEEERKRLTAETADILACWLIIREYYNDRGDIVESDCEEGFIKTYAYQVLDMATQQWRTVRSYFDHVNFGREIDPTKERFKEITIYV